MLYAVMIDPLLHFLQLSARIQNAHSALMIGPCNERIRNQLQHTGNKTRKQPVRSQGC